MILKTVVLTINSIFYKITKYRSHNYSNLCTFGSFGLDSLVADHSNGRRFILKLNDGSMLSIVAYQWKKSDTIIEIPCDMKPIRSFKPSSCQLIYTTSHLDL